MTASYFFGYGSLVNYSTHSYTDAHPARLNGWRRQWRHTDLRPIGFLTAVPDDNCAIDGIIAHVPNDDWSALDKREFAYRRVISTPDVSHPKSDPVEIAVYTSRTEHDLPNNQCHPLLLSYIDVVVQGYLHQFGETGVADFFATTSGWEAPVLNDRAAPQYPRHRELSVAETALVDHHLGALDVSIIT